MTKSVKIFNNRSLPMASINPATPCIAFCSIEGAWTPPRTRARRRLDGCQPHRRLRLGAASRSTEAYGWPANHSPGGTGMALDSARAAQESLVGGISTKEVGRSTPPATTQHPLKENFDQKIGAPGNWGGGGSDPRPGWGGSTPHRHP